MPRSAPALTPAPTRSPAPFAQPPAGPRGPAARPSGRTCPSWSRCRCGWRPTRRSWSPGACRLVLQVHDERDPLHVRDAASLWRDPPSVHGFGDRARTHATLALREAATAWSPLELLLEQRVPDELTLETDDLVSLLDHGVAALREVGVDVLWPRSLGRDLSATATLDRAPGKREGQLVEGVLSGDALFAFNWQVALRGRPADRAGDGPAGPGVLADAQAAWRVDRRGPGHRPQGPQAADPHRPRGCGGRGGADRCGRGGGRARRGRGGRQPARGARAAPGRRHRPAAALAARGWRRPCATTSATASPGSTR